MSTVEIKKELHNYIETGNEHFVEHLHATAKALYEDQLEKDKMIEEAEEDISAGRLYSQEEIKAFIENWRK